MKIYINGKDGSGWAIDGIRWDVQAALKRLELKQTKNFLAANIIHNIWWNKILAWKYMHIRLKKNILLTAVNYIDMEDENYFLKETFEKANKMAAGWISPSTKQQKILEKYHKKVYVMPYYLDLKLFDYANISTTKEQILKKFHIPPEVVKDKVIISSFQRDTAGYDLTVPKWQKGPELLIELLKDLPKDKFILLLASSRRHYVINECKKHGIPHYYLGKESDEDDIGYNNLPLEKMPELYYISDLYLVTSKSEGGPKAVCESAAMKTFIMTTDVGLAADFVNDEYVFSDMEKYKKAVVHFVSNFSLLQAERKKQTEELYKRCLNKLSYTTLDNQLLEIYKDVLNKK